MEAMRSYVGPYNMESAYPDRLVSSKSAPALARNGKRAENVVKRDVFARRAEKYAPGKETLGQKRWKSLEKQWFLASLVDDPPDRGSSPEVGNEGDHNGYPRKTLEFRTFFRLRHPQTHGPCLWGRQPSRKRKHELGKS